MKRYKKYITVLVTVMMLFYSISKNIVVYAADHVTGDNVAYRVSGVLPSLNWTYLPAIGAYNYYVDDPTGIPTGGGYYFFKYGNDNKFGAFTQANMFTFILNNGLGLTCSSERAADLITAYYQSISNVDSGNLYDGNGNKLGIVLNDISGCVYENYPNNTDCVVPSQEINNVYNFYQYYINHVSPETPDYINVVTRSASQVKAAINVTNSYVNSYKNYLDSMSPGGWFYGAVYYNSTTMLGNQNISNYGYYNDATGCTCYCTNSWSTICNAFNLKENGSEIKYTDVISQPNELTFYVTRYDTTNGSIKSNNTKVTFNTSGTYSEENAQYFPILNIYRAYRTYPVSSDGAFFTIYKDSNVVTSIVNNTYSPSTFTSNRYNNFNEQNTTNISTNSNVVNNSSTTNNSIYNDASQSFTEYYSEQNDYNIDNSVVIENTTEIIYNYYGNDGGGGDDGGGGSDDDDNDPIWTALLKAIADFFKKLGELIATVLTGIVTILTSILEAIATIVTDFTGITDFLGQIFAWLPSEIITLMTLGLTTALFAAFLTWFKK